MLRVSVVLEFDHLATFKTESSTLKEELEGSTVERGPEFQSSNYNILWQCHFYMDINEPV